MTALHATPAGLPPRLPVRDRSGAAERVPRGLSPMLSRLAAERATGVLLRERGTLYLAEGRVVHAESPAAPGLDVLLIAHGTLSPDAWQDAVARADERHGAARLLVDSGRLTPGTLELCHLSALYDAAYFALAPSSAPGRFRYGTGHWLGPVRPVPVSALERETLRRRDLLHRIWPDPGTDTAPLARADPSPRLPPLTARQQAVLALLDGTRTAPDIARALGRPTFHTLVDIRRLAAAGALKPHPQAPDTASRTQAPGPAQRPPAPGPNPRSQAPGPNPRPQAPGPAQRPPAPGPNPRPQAPGPDPRPQSPGPGPGPDQAPPTRAPHGTAPPSPATGRTVPRARPPAPAERLTPDATRSTPPAPATTSPPLPTRPNTPSPAERPTPRTTWSTPPAPATAPPPLPTRPNPPSPAERLAPDHPDIALLKRVRDALEAL
ncbi:hypothetical protein BN159_5211 [Streptomyces davaonensis JCM 4913]|uniref:Uncharacterized protein n=1 Tax=Streptomyces davaonensis (strain DSM 101723 / JCM 4913 / KCC S-0913 / 768) TaxID=1214101 RepID=K4R943_STRDJ|nr:hypothetical protein BN159_5211 [Streptomyces davaonensis JCM 4913]